MNRSPLVTATTRTMPPMPPNGWPLGARPLLVCATCGQSKAGHAVSIHPFR